MKNNPLFGWLIGVIVVAIVFLIFLIDIASDITKKDQEIKELELLVEYHQNQTFELVEELHDLKKGREK